MPYELLGRLRRILKHALGRPRCRASCRVARIFLGMISSGCRMVKELDRSFVYAGTFLTVNRLGPSTVLFDRSSHNSGFLIFYPGSFGRFLLAHARRL